MKIGLHDEWSPVEEPWNQDLEDMWITHEQTEREMYPENQENCQLSLTTLSHEHFPPRNRHLGFCDRHSQRVKSNRAKMWSFPAGKGFIPR